MIAGTSFLLSRAGPDESNGFFGGTLSPNLSPRPANGSPFQPTPANSMASASFGDFEELRGRHFPRNWSPGLSPAANENGVESATGFNSVLTSRAPFARLARSLAHLPHGVRSFIVETIAETAMLSGGTDWRYFHRAAPTC